VTISFYAQGTPAPQGSKSAMKHKTTGKIIVLESGRKTVRPWRKAVKEAAREHGGKVPAGEPVHVTLAFYLPRPKGHYRTGRYADILKDSAPTIPTTKPDLDKLIRSTLDALTEAGTYQDDSNVWMISASKSYADACVPGANIIITPWSEIAEDDGE
jgi:crossover junction endodeoxyribonuclease RusA